MARRMTSLPVLTLLILTAALGLAAPAQSQDKPRSGGELVFLVPSEPPSYTLLRIDPTDTSGTRVVPDLRQ